MDMIYQSSKSQDRGTRIVLRDLTRRDPEGRANFLFMMLLRCQFRNQDKYVDSSDDEMHAPTFIGDDDEVERENLHDEDDVIMPLVKAGLSIEKTEGVETKSEVHSPTFHPSPDEHELTSPADDTPVPRTVQPDQCLPLNAGTVKQEEPSAQAAPASGGPPGLPSNASTVKQEESSPQAASASGGPRAEPVDDDSGAVGDIRASAASDRAGLVLGLAPQHANTYTTWRSEWAFSRAMAWLLNHRREAFQE